MRQKAATIRFPIFFLALIIPSLTWGALKLAGKDQVFNVETGENRHMHTMPENVKLSDLTSELELTYNDHVPFRSALLKAYQLMNQIVERPYTYRIEPAMLAALNGDEGDFFPTRQLGHGVIQGRDGWLFLEKTIADYQGSNLFEEETMASLTEDMVRLRDICDKHAVGLHYIFFPNKCSVYSEYMPTITRGETTRLQLLQDYVQSHSDLSFDFILDEMEEAKRDHQLYYKNDTHWNAYGALVGVNTLYPLLGLPAVDEHSLDPASSARDGGDLIAMAELRKEDLEADTEWNLHYKPEIAKTVKHKVTKLERMHETFSAAADKRTIVLIGDSFNNALIDYIACDFSHVIYVSWEVLDQADTELIRRADILIVDGVERNVTKLNSMVETLTEMLAD